MNLRTAAQMESSNQNNVTTEPSLEQNYKGKPMGAVSVFMTGISHCQPNKMLIIIKYQARCYIRVKYQTNWL